MGAGSSIPKGTHVVVVGGNFGGIKAAQALEKAGANVTVIEPKDRLYVTFGGVRAGVVDDFENTLLVPYDRVFKSSASKIVRAFATGVDDKTRSVTYQPLGSDGQPSGPTAVVQYDFLVVATGSLYGPPMKGANTVGEMKEGLKAVRAAVKAAQNIVVVGGGATGVETAGEIREAYPTKTVTIVHGGSHVLNQPGSAFPLKFQERMAQEIQKAGIQLTTNARVDLEAIKSAPGVTAINAGYLAGSQIVKVGSSEVPADLVILATGARPNTAWLKGSSLENKLDTHGFVKVELTYQVKDSPRVFSIGDCCGSPDAKSGWLIDTQVKVMVKNVTKLAKAGGQVESANVQLVQQKKPLNGLGVVPVGNKHGAGFIPGMGVVKFILPMKTKAFFADVQAKSMGYTLAELSKLNAKTA